MAKQALGRGLDALIQRSSEQRPVGGTTLKGERVVQHVAIERLAPSPLQPRKQFSEEQLEDLLDSIREHGIIQPLIVREVGKQLELIAGERRWRASQQLGLKEVPVIVRSASDRDVLEMALIENLQREDLNPVEQAQAYLRLQEDFGLKQEEIAKRVGKKRATVANALRLLSLSADVLALLRSGQLSAGHAKALLGLEDARLQLLAAKEVLGKKLSVRATEQLVAKKSREAMGSLHGQEGGTGQRSENKGGANAEYAQALSAELRAVRKRLREFLGTQVEIRHSESKGKIEIEYYGNDDLQRLIELLGLEEHW